MALNVDSGGKEELKTQFITREGTYRLMTLSEYSRPNRVGYTNIQGSTSVRVSFVTLPDPNGNGDRICFNIGRELYVFIYKGVKKAADLTKPVDKKMYKGTNPTCHDFNTANMTSDSVSLLVGFSTGQVQLIDPIKKELSKLYNEERMIDKTKVTCIRWVPGSTNLFLVSHSSGQLYLYNEELPCGTSPPNYQPFKQGDSFAIHTCKTKSTRNPLYRWVIGNEGVSINEFAFSPCGSYLAIVSQDGFLRVFHYNTMELVGSARSYFGGFLCVCWSPDCKYIVVGGEDDLVTVWSFVEKRVVARGQGHHSWVSVVAFDPYTSTFAMKEWNENTSPSENKVDTCYRLGSVGQDTQLCLWDITDDILRQKPCSKTRNTVVSGSVSPSSNSNKTSQNTSASKEKDGLEAISSFTHRLGIGFEKKDNVGHKRSLSKGTTLQLTNNSSDDPMRLIGTNSCPRFDECPIMEPLVCKKIAHERLTALVFREDCFVAACQDGYVYTWARPGKMVSDGDFVTFS
ncbi:WD repeat-containing protein 20 isoform X1 [Halyomorpha halys]|uniref:WD repeat-containing protein 20 isoform X1 n=2 Tax=Halyomorpha halys TaxID=286706 RepID=UPI0006D4E4C8|nr:WD repeat-containing protein 20 [Halyomorpha halys]